MSMLGYLMEHLVYCYRGEGVFTFENEVNMVLKDVALILGLRLVNLGLKSKAIEETNFRDRYFPA